MNFQVYYSPSALPAHEPPLETEMIEHCYSCLNMDVHTRLIRKGVTSDVHTIRGKNQEPAYAEVSLDDGGQGLDITVVLAECVADINGTTAGLCFLIRSSSSKQPSPNDEP